ncbi:MAG: zinc metallopeptidase, partial [Clostridia bacterium]
LTMLNVFALRGFEGYQKMTHNQQKVQFMSHATKMKIAVHEAGHAIQYAQNYSPIKIRNAIIPVTNFGARFSFVFILLGILFSQTYWLIWVGIALYSLTAVFQLVTLPVEFNASARALKILENNYILQNEEVDGAKKVLSAAAMTYVAALVTSLAQILRLILIYGRRRND